MPSYQPFLIASFDIGLMLDKEPWLLPSKAFSKMENAFLRDGYIEKRMGYSEWADTGSSDAVVGIHNFIETSGAETPIVNTVDRLYEWNGTALVDKDSSDVWTGDTTNLVSAVNAAGKLYMANGKNLIRSYDGTAPANVSWTLPAGLTTLNFCRHLAYYKRRLILFDTQEDGTRYLKRARWSSVTNVEDLSADEYIDCPTSESIVTTAPINDDIIVVFSKSVWLFRYTGDPILPFRWEKISSSDGASAFFTGTAFRDKVSALGKAGLIVTDGTNVEKIDDRVPDLTLSMNSTSLPYSHSILFEELRQIWTFYPSLNATANDEVLVFNYKDFDWAILKDMPFICAGSYNSETTYTWSNITGTWEDSTDNWIGDSLHAGYPQILAGKSDGKVYVLQSGSSDDGEAIAMDIETGRFNPLKERGLKARLGYVDFLVTKEAGSEAYIDFYLDFEKSAYTTKTLSFATDADVDKHWVRVYVNATGNSHKMRIYQDDSGVLPKIHAIMIYVKPAGRIIN